MKAYAAYYDNSVRLSSSSGGLISLIASQFDVVYGVCLTQDCYGCEFVRIEGDISELRGSKYMQAEMGKTFCLAKQDLIEGKKVLFTGTGCQINGLVCFLQKDYENLFLIDVICHGVPSPKLWKMYIQNQEKQGGKIRKVNFRSKDNGWKNFGMKENQLYISKDKDEYMQMFLRNYSLRPSCYECRAKTYKKADMTVGDFWGIEEVAPELDDGQGTSLVIVRTTKGEQLYELIKKDLVWKEVDYDQSVKFNSAEYKSVVRPQLRDSFFDDMNSMAFSDLSHKYLEDPTGHKLVHKAKYYINKLFRR